MNCLKGFIFLMMTYHGLALGLNLPSARIDASKFTVIYLILFLFYLTILYPSYSYSAISGYQNQGKLNDLSNSSAISVKNSTWNEVSPGRIHVLYDVPLVPQETGYSCWAAGAAMIVSWRDGVRVSPFEIANAIGYWKQYEEGLEPSDTTMLRHWGLISEAPYSYSPDEFAKLLLLYGPLWVASAEPGPHIRVVTGVVGDGTYDGTILYVNDPWQTGMEEFQMPNFGSQYAETFFQFMHKQEELAYGEIEVHGPIYVAHLPLFAQAGQGKQ